MRMQVEVVRCAAVVEAKAQMETRLWIFFFSVLFFFFFNTRRWKLTYAICMELYEVNWVGAWVCPPVFELTICIVCVDYMAWRLLHLPVMNCYKNSLTMLAFTLAPASESTDIFSKCLYTWFIFVCIPMHAEPRCQCFHFMCGFFRRHQIVRWGEGRLNFSVCLVGILLHSGPPPN